MKTFKLSKFQTFVNKCFKTLQFSLLVVHSDNFFPTQETFAHQKCERNDW